MVTSLKWGIKDKKGWIPMFLSIGGFFPWIFGSYLVLVHSSLIFNELINGGFALLFLIELFLSIYLGYLIVSKNYLIIIAERKMKEGWNKAI